MRFIFHAAGMTFALAARPSSDFGPLTSGEQLGEGVWSTVHRGTHASGRSFAIKCDKCSWPASDIEREYFTKERDVFYALKGSPNVGPQLHDYLVTRQDDGKVKRCWVMELVGQSIKRRIMSEGPVTEQFALQVMDKVIRLVQELRDAGYYHNDVHSDNVAFKAGSAGIEDLLLIDFGNAVRTVGEMPEIIATEFSVSKVYNDHAKSVSQTSGGTANTDLVWFQNLLRSSDQARADAQIADFIKKDNNWLVWSPISRAAIRNSRIFQSMAHALEPSHLNIADSAADIHEEIIRREVAANIPQGERTEFSWLVWALTQELNDEEAKLDRYLDSRKWMLGDIANMIMATRALGVYQLEARNRDSTMRKDFARIVKLFLEMFSAATPEQHDPLHNWFWEDLMNVDRAALAVKPNINAYIITLVARDALLLAWDVMHGADADFGRLAAVFGSSFRTAQPFVKLEHMIVDQPRGPHRSTVIYLHGMTDVAYGQLSGFKKKGFFTYMGEGVRIVGPQIKVTNRNPKVEWFPFLAEPWTQASVAALGDKAALDETLAVLLPLIDVEAAKFGGDYSKVFIVGWSKGGMMASYVALMANRPLGGVVNHLGAFPLLPSSEVRATAHGINVPVLHIHDRRDSIVLYQFAESGVEAARAAGSTGYTAIVEITVEGNTHHGLCPGSLRHGGEWIAARIPLH